MIKFSIFLAASLFAADQAVATTETIQVSVKAVGGFGFDPTVGLRYGSAPFVAAYSMTPARMLSIAASGQNYFVGYGPIGPEAYVGTPIQGLQQLALKEIAGVPNSEINCGALIEHSFRRRP